jgi:hypothetical protein
MSGKTSGTDKRENPRSRIEQKHERAVSINVVQIRDGSEHAEQAE